MAQPILWADFSIQWIIPAVFLVIWALNQVFGREERPAPAAGRREPLGPRPGAPNRAPRPLPRPEAGRGNDPAMRWPELEPRDRDRDLGQRGSRPPADQEEVFLIPASESARDSARSRQAGGPGRRPPRGRSAGPTTPGAVPMGSTQSLGSSLLQAGSVTTTLGHLGAPNLDESPSKVLGSPSEAARVYSTVSLVDRSSEELRRAIVLGEILRPPLALRRPGR